MKALTQITILLALQGCATIDKPPQQMAVLPGCPAAAVTPVPPHYPEELRDQGIAGEVVLAVTVDGCGVPLNVQVQRSSRNRQLDREAMNAAYTWRLFVPPEHRANGGVILVPINFDPDH
ncbi:MAG: energy transducer TonB [Rhizobium sp.]|nr:energy transducer TonB [Rhizobium sp.]